MFVCPAKSEEAVQVLNEHLQTTVMKWSREQPSVEPLEFWCPPLHIPVLFLESIFNVILHTLVYVRTVDSLTDTDRRRRSFPPSETEVLEFGLRYIKLSDVHLEKLITSKLRSLVHALHHRAAVLAAGQPARCTIDSSRVNRLEKRACSTTERNEACEWRFRDQAPIQRTNVPGPGLRLEACTRQPDLSAHGTSCPFISLNNEDDPHYVYVIVEFSSFRSSSVWSVSHGQSIPFETWVFPVSLFITGRPKESPSDLWGPGDQPPPASVDVPRLVDAAVFTQQGLRSCESGELETSGDSRPCSQRGSKGHIYSTGYGYSLEPVFTDRWADSRTSGTTTDGTPDHAASSVSGTRYASLAAQTSLSRQGSRTGVAPSIGTLPLLHQSSTSSRLRSSLDRSSESNVITKHDSCVAFSDRQLDSLERDADCWKPITEHRKLKVQCKNNRFAAPTSVLLGKPLRRVLKAIIQNAGEHLDHLPPPPDDLPFYRFNVGFSYGSDTLTLPSQTHPLAPSKGMDFILPPFTSSRSQRPVSSVTASLSNTIRGIPDVLHHPIVRNIPYII